VRAVIQRVSRAEVRVDGAVVGRCGPGLCLLVGVRHSDTTTIAEQMAQKIVNLRIFNDGDGKMNLALPVPEAQKEPCILAISNFTVYGDAQKNRRPSFTESAKFELGKELFDHFVEKLRGLGFQTETGEFGADMHVELVNDGPVTIVLDVD